MKTIFTSLLLLFSVSMTLAQNTWPKESVSAYMDNCVSEASKALDKSTATEYCSCTLQKLEIRYPDAADLNNLQQEEINELAKVCLNEVSSKNDNTQSNKTNTGNSSAPQPPRPAGSSGASTSLVKTGATNWSSTAYDAFMNSCVDSAKESLGETPARKYCACAAGKLQVSHPDETKLNDIPAEEINKVAKECLGN